MDTLSDDAVSLLEAMARPASLLERLGARGSKPETLARLAALGEIGIVPSLLDLLARDDAHFDGVAAAIDTLIHGVSIATLSWLDQAARRHHASHIDHGHSWYRLSPSVVPRWSQRLAGRVRVLGLVGSHPDGYVREAVVSAIGGVTDGQEIPFLALRANDWVEPVARLATEQLVRRLVPENRDAVFAALPLLVRTLNQRRRDHGGLGAALRTVLGADSGSAALERLRTWDPPTRRMVLALLEDAGATSSQDPILRACLQDPDPSLRRRAIRRLAETTDLDASAALLERLVSRDAMPGLRAEALRLLARRAPERARMQLHEALLDASAGVRHLARFLVRELAAPIEPSAVYLGALDAAAPRRLATAVSGVGETGTAVDLDRIRPVSGHAAPCVRAAVLRASARLSADAASSLAMDALTDPARSVRGAALRLLEMQARTVDFDAVVERLRRLASPQARRDGLTLVRHAPKWQAVTLLLDALADPDPDVRRLAAQLIDDWVAAFNRSQVQPSLRQAQRLAVLVDMHADQLSPATARFLRFAPGAPTAPTPG